MSEIRFNAEQYMDAVSSAVGLPIPEEYRAESLTYLLAAADIAGPLLAFDLEQSLEPAITFSVSTLKA